MAVNRILDDQNRRTGLAEASLCLSLTWPAPRAVEEPGAAGTPPAREEAADRVESGTDLVPCCLDGSDD